MQVIDVSVEENGIVLFDKDVICHYYNDSIDDGANLFKRYVETDEGEDVLNSGIILPILSIDDMGYDIIIKYDFESCDEEKYILFSNGVFPFCIKNKAIIADLYSIINWNKNISTDYDVVDVSPGFYGVTVSGYRIDDKNEYILKAGYIFSFKKEKQLPILTGKTDFSMRLIDL